MVVGFGFNRDYALYCAPGLEGMIDDSVPHDVLTLSNFATSKTQVSRIIVGTPANSAQYILIFNSTKLGIEPTTVVYTSDANATATEIQNGLITAINQNLLLSGKFKPSKDGTDILIASRYSGLAGEFNLTASGGGTGFASSVLTNAADPAVIPFGRLLWQRSSDANRNCRVIDGPIASGVVRGFSVRTEAHESPYPGMQVGYYSTQEVNALAKGRMQIRPVTDMHPTSQIHVYITGENQGRLRSSADGTDTVQYTGTGIRIYEPVKANQIGRVEVNLP